MSRIGGCINVGPVMGGPAGDHACMEAAGLFIADKWAVPEGHLRPRSLYDAGVTARSKVAAAAAGYDLCTSGIVRNSVENPLSFIQRESCFASYSG